MAGLCCVTALLWPSGTGHFCSFPGKGGGFGVGGDVGVGSSDVGLEGRSGWNSGESQTVSEWHTGKSRLQMLLERGKASDVSWEKGRRHQGIFQ